MQASVRARLILVFAAATLVPLAITVWITSSLLQRSLSLASTREVDELSRSLEQTGRALFIATRDALRADALLGRSTPVTWHAAQRESWPSEAREFASSDEKERFTLSGEARDGMNYYLRRGADVLVYSRPVGMEMHRLTEQHARARALVQRTSGRDLRRGFTVYLIILAAAVWCLSLVALVWLAYRITRPVQQLTSGLARLASGDLDARLRPQGHDEVSAAMLAFNDTATKLQASRERLVAVTRLASWQTLARKMAHEVKNSLTPIRLTMEELIARRGNDPQFLMQAAQIVVDEVLTLERRVRAFSEFASEPPVRLGPVDLDSLLQERLTLLRAAHSDVIYETRLTSGAIAAADEDLLKGVLTNLLENAAEAAGRDGRVLVKSTLVEDQIELEIHDSGPGLSSPARETLFEPTISFKKAGMGLGLSIARKSALLLGGDITLIEGELGGAAFRVVLPAFKHSWQDESSSLMTKRTSAVPSA